MVGISAFLTWNSKTQLSTIVNTGSLKLVTRNSPDTYFIEKDRAAGFEYDLAKAYAQYLGVKLELVLAKNFYDIATTIKQHDAHIAGAMITVTPKLEAEFDFTHPYLATTIGLIYRETLGNPAPRNLKDLIASNKQLVVQAGSSHIEQLKQLQKHYPKLSWQEREQTPMELLEQVYNKEIYYTLVDSLIFEAQKPFFPGLEKAFVLNKPQPIAWMLSPHHDQSLKDSINSFLAFNNTQKLITELKKKYFSYDNPLSSYSTSVFKNNLKTRLPELMPYFIEASQKTGISWQLLAAVAYQESHWNPAAVSPTDVKGIMMLTKATASEVGVTDRRDPKQSILGGAKYLLKVMRRIPSYIKQPDRTWFALASYNVGYGHLEDARTLTKRGGKNPNKWHDVSQFLPQLTKRKYFSTVRYGYARGHEPVQYVSRINEYIQLINWSSSAQTGSLPFDITQPTLENTEDTKQDSPLMSDFLPAF